MIQKLHPSKQFLPIIIVIALSSFSQVLSFSATSDYTRPHCRQVITPFSLDDPIILKEDTNQDLKIQQNNNSNVNLVFPEKDMTCIELKSKFCYYNKLIACPSNQLCTRDLRECSENRANLNYFYPADMDDPDYFNDERRKSSQLVENELFYEEQVYTTSNKANSFSFIRKQSKDDFMSKLSEEVGKHIHQFLYGKPTPQPLPQPQSLQPQLPTLRGSSLASSRVNGGYEQQRRGIPISYIFPPTKLRQAQIVPVNKIFNISAIFSSHNNKNGGNYESIRAYAQSSLSSVESKQKVGVQSLLAYHNLSKKERRMKRKKIFVLSTFLDDFLPDPCQGQTWLLNVIVDAIKISVRVMIWGLSLTRIVPPPRELRDQDEQKNFM